MSGGVPHEDKRVKFTERSVELFGKWAEDATDEDHQAVSEALMRVVEGSWRENYECHEDVAHGLTWHITVRLPTFTRASRFTFSSLLLSKACCEGSLP